MAGQRHKRRAQESFGVELRRLLGQQGVSLRQFAAAVGVPQPYLSRTLSGGRPPSINLLTRVSEELGLPADYFAEYRLHVVLEAAKADAELRDRVYDSLSVAKPPPG